MADCWLAQFAPEVPCDGALQRCHLLPKQRLRRLWRSRYHERGQPPRPIPGYSSLEELLMDPRTWRPGCERHHFMLDCSRKLRIPRAEIPLETETLARLLGFDGWLDREYGELVA